MPTRHFVGKVAGCMVTARFAYFGQLNAYPIPAEIIYIGTAYEFSELGGQQYTTDRQELHNTSAHTVRLLSVCSVCSQFAEHT